MVITNILAFLGDLGGSEILLILIVILLLFGAKRIPELARGLGKGINEFKNAAKEVTSEISNAANDDEKSHVTSTPTPARDVRVKSNEAPTDERVVR